MNHAGHNPAAASVNRPMGSRQRTLTLIIVILLCFIILSQLITTGGQQRSPRSRQLTTKRNTKKSSRKGATELAEEEEQHEAVESTRKVGKRKKAKADDDASAATGGDAARSTNPSDDDDMVPVGTNPPMRRQKEDEAQATTFFVPKDDEEKLFFSDPSVRAAQSMLYDLSQQQKLPVKACFVALVRNTPDGLSRFNRLLLNLQQYLPSMSHSYPFVAFFDPGTKLDQVADTLHDLRTLPHGHRSGGELPLMHLFPGGLLLSSLSDDDFGQIPPWVQPEHNHPWPYPSSSYWGVAYRHMCRFFAVRIPYLTQLASYDYYMRFDTDSWILATPMTTLLEPARELVSGGAAAGGKPNLVVLDDEQQQEQHGDKKGSGVAAPLKDEEEFDTGMATWVEKLGFTERRMDMDFFKEASRRKALYSYSMVHHQGEPIFLQDLFESVDEWIQHEGGGHYSNRQVPHAGDIMGPDGKPWMISAGVGTIGSPRGIALHYWDNIEIVDLRLFRATKGSHAGGGVFKSHAADVQLQVGRFLSKMDRKGGFYYHRWGDAEVRTLTMSMFVPPQNIAWLDALPYQHYHNYHCPEFVHPHVASEGGDGTKDALPLDWTHANFTAYLKEKILPIRRVTNSRGHAFDVAVTADELVMLFSPLRRSLIKVTQSGCELERRRSSNGKGAGTASMLPAEHAINSEMVYHYNIDACGKSFCQRVV